MLIKIDKEGLFLVIVVIGICCVVFNGLLFIIVNFKIKYLRDFRSLILFIIGIKVMFMYMGYSGMKSLYN